MEFRAKDIQKYLDIKKNRYEYLHKKMGIIPEVPVTSNKGGYHRFSFKNFVEFVFVYNANILGLGPNETQEMLIILHNFDANKKADVFEPNVPLESLKLLLVTNGDNRDFIIKTNHLTLLYPCYSPHIELLKTYENYNISETGIETLTDEELEKYIWILEKSTHDAVKKLKEYLDNADGYITMNIAVQKNNLIEYLYK